MTDLNADLNAFQTSDTTLKTDATKLANDEAAYPVIQLADTNTVNSLTSVQLGDSTAASAASTAFSAYFAQYLPGGTPTAPYNPDTAAALFATLSATTSALVAVNASLAAAVSQQTTDNAVVPNDEATVATDTTAATAALGTLKTDVDAATL